MAERFRSALPKRKVEVIAALQLRISVEPNTSEIDLGRMFNFCENAGAEECEASIDHFVTSQAEAIETLDAPITPDQLRVVVRHSEYCDAIHGGRPPVSAEPATRPFVSGLCTLIVADFPNRTRSLSPDQLGEMGLDLDAAWTLAERQTLADLPRPDAIEGLEERPVAIVGLRYIPTLLLDTEGWRAAREKYGDLLAAAPASDEMIVAQAQSVEDLESLRAVARRQFETAERGVSPMLYRFGAMGWEPEQSSRTV